jgi:hypothetical protein
MRRTTIGRLQYFVLAFGFAATSCSHTAPPIHREVGSPRHNPLGVSEVQDILVLTSDPPSSPYTVVVRFSTDDIGCGPRAVEYMKELARRYDGDAVVVECAGPGHVFLPPFTATPFNSNFNIQGEVIRFITWWRPSKTKRLLDTQKGPALTLP